MNKLFISQNRGGNLFQYKSIEVYVNDFGAKELKEVNVEINFEVFSVEMRT